MTDIFREVDEDLRRDKAMSLWMRFRWPLAGVVAAIVLCTAGWQGWTYWRAIEAGRAADKFLAAVDLADKGKSAEAIAAFEAGSSEAPKGYAALDRLRAAGEKAKVGDGAGALALLDAVAGDGSLPRPVRDLANLRAAAVLVDTGSLADVEKRAGAFDDPGSEWRNVARELIGLAAWKGGDFARARRELLPVTTDFQASESLRARASLILTLCDAAIGHAGAASDAPVPLSSAAGATK